MIRLPAEWEEQDALLVALPHVKSDWLYCIDEILCSYVDFIETVAKFQKCIVLVDDVQKARYLFKNATNIELVEIATDDTWIRDFGMIDVEDNGKFKSYDFTFNGWGGKYDALLDNNVNKKLFSKRILQGELICKDFILEGGSIDTNGKGIMLTTAKCVFNKNRNFHLDGKQIEKKLKELFGLKELIVLNHGAILGDDTDSHIDTLARFINEDTIAYVTCKDETNIHFAPLKQMEDELKKTGFNLLELPLPQPIFYEKRALPATYANFVFVNGGLIVPTYGDLCDKLVIKKFQEVLPHLQVVGVDARVFIRENGSLHCACMNYFKGKR